MKLGNEEFTINEMDLMATYEEVYKIPYENQITRWWGDLGLHEFKHGVKLEEANEVFQKALKAINMTREEFSAQQYVYRKEIADEMKENMPVKYDVVTVFDKPMLFTNERIKKEDVPEGLYRYEIRDTDENSGEMAQIKDWVMVSHWGTVLTKEPVEPREVEGRVFTTAEGIDMDGEDYNFTGETCTVEEYLERYNEFVSEYGVPEQDNGLTMR